MVLLAPVKVGPFFFQKKKPWFLKKNEVTCMKKYWFLQVFSKSRSFFENHWFLSESVISRVSQFRMCIFPKRILECHQGLVKGTPGCRLSCGKNGWCRNEKNGPLENVHFVLENIWETLSNVWFPRCQSACFRMSSIPQGISGATGRLPFFTR